MGANSKKLSEEVLYEVWREHLKGGPDLIVQRQTTEEIAREHLARCQEDELLKNFVTFYLVKVSLTRKRVE